MLILQTLVNVHRFIQLVGKVFMELGKIMNHSISRVYYFVGYKGIVEILVENGANIHCRNSYNFRSQLARIVYFADGNFENYFSANKTTYFSYLYLKCVKSVRKSVPH